MIVFQLKYRTEPDEATGLLRIIAVRDVRPGVKPGDWGGLIESESNLSHEGTCWVFDSARVSGSAQVYASARVFDSARVYDSAQVCDSAQASGSARVYGWAQVSGDADLSKPEHLLTALVQASGMYYSTLARTRDGHRLAVGCWDDGGVDEFEQMILSDEWVKADAATRELRRPELLAFVAMCRARIASWGDRTAGATGISWPRSGELGS